MLHPANRYGGGAVNSVADHHPIHAFHTMLDWFKQRMPQPESLAQNRWLSWLGPALYHPRLWRFSRKGLALGVAIGIFFGLLIPIAQIPVSAALAVALRANLPAAMVSTLVTNPVTFGPVYYAAYHTGAWMLAAEPTEATAAPAALAPEPASETQPAFSLAGLWAYISGVGKPLVLGLAVFAVCGCSLVYVGVNWFWIWRVRRRWRQRKQQAAKPG